MTESMGFSKASHKYEKNCGQKFFQVAIYNVMGDKATALIYIKEVSILLSNYSQN